jgi:hypothetical protein
LTKVFSTFILIIITSGCVTAGKLGELPNNKIEYKKEKAYLLQRYPEIGKK